MDNNDYCPLGLLDGIDVGVQPTLDGQDILIRHSEWGCVDWRAAARRGG